MKHRAIKISILLLLTLSIISFASYDYATTPSEDAIIICKADPEPDEDPYDEDVPYRP